MTIESFCEKAEKIISAVDTPTAEYALDLIEHLKENADCYQDALTGYYPLKKALLNGAMDWNHYSESGCSLCYDYDIRERLRLYKISKNGIKHHAKISGMKLLHLQAELLRQAFLWIDELRKECI